MIQQTYIVAVLLLLGVSTITQAKEPIPWFVQGAIGAGVNGEEVLSNNYIGAGFVISPVFETGINFHYRYGYWDDKKRQRFDPEIWLRMKTVIEWKTQFYGELGWQWHNATPYVGLGVLYAATPLVDVNVGYRYYHDGMLPSGRDDVASVYMGVRVVLDSSIVERIDL